MTISCENNNMNIFFKKMSDGIANIDINEKSNKNHLLFEIKGNEEYGLDKTIVNAIRRTLLSSIETYAFRTSYNNPGINDVLK